MPRYYTPKPRNLSDDERNAWHAAIEARYAGLRFRHENEVYAQHGRVYAGSEYVATLGTTNAPDDARDWADRIAAFDRVDGRVVLNDHPACTCPPDAARPEDCTECPTHGPAALEELRLEQQSEIDAENAWLRHAENAGWDDDPRGQ